MRDAAGGVDVGRAVRCLFRQDGWARILAMGTLFMFIPMVGPIAFQGYAVRVFKHLVLSGDDRNLPPMEGFSELMNLGMMPFILSMLYMFPLIFLVYIGLGVGIGAGMLLVGVIIAGLAAAGLDPGIATAVGGLLALVVGLLAFVLVYGLIILLSYPLQAVHTMVEITGKIEHAWRFSEVMAYIRALRPDYRRAFIRTFLYNLLIMTCGMLLCSVGVYPAAVVMAVAGAHVRAQLYRIYLARGHEPLPMDPRL